jgi:hypothetical protein
MLACCAIYLVYRYYNRECHWDKGLFRKETLHAHNSQNKLQYKYTQIKLFNKKHTNGKQSANMSSMKQLQLPERHPEVIGKMGCIETIRWFTY